MLIKEEVLTTDPQAIWSK